jgi:hypothetical protein
MPEEKTSTGSSLPFVNAYNSIPKVLEKIQSAATPERFTQDFLSTKLGMRGGSYKPLIPFLKRIGFLNSDGTPSELYKRYRNPASKPAAVAAAIQQGYAPLYEINEYAHNLDEKELKGVVVQATGLDAKASSVNAIVKSFSLLKDVADFDAEMQEESDTEEPDDDEKSVDNTQKVIKGTKGVSVGLKLGYTINLNLPASSDVAVFNAIFKSLKENLLDQ